MTKNKKSSDTGEIFLQNSSRPVNGAFAMTSPASLIMGCASLVVWQLYCFFPCVADAQTISATQESEAAIRVVATGRFETTFTKRKGFGHVWFDLEHDPQKSRDLAPVDDENGFLWIKAAPAASTEGSWYANPVQELELLE